MRIAYITGQYPRATDTFIQREVFALRNQGVEVHTFSIRQTGDEHIVGQEQQSEQAKTFYVLPISLVKLFLIHAQLCFQHPKRYLKAIKLALSTCFPGLRGLLYQLFYFAEAGVVAREMQVRNLSHLHNHSPLSSGNVTLLASEIGGFTFSLTLHGPYVFFSAEQWHLGEKLNRALFISCISHFARSQGMLYADLKAWPRMHIVHCGVNPDEFKVVSHQGIGHRLLYVGRLATTKGLPVLLESLAILRFTFPNVVLTVVGDGADKYLLQEVASTLGIGDAINFVGYQSQSKVREYMQHTDVLVLPSFAEGVPVVLMEAMATAVPVVATRIAGINELIEHGVSGYLVPPGDVDSLTKAIENLLRDDQLRMAFGRVGRATVEKEFNIETEVAHLFDVMQIALTGEGAINHLLSSGETKIHAISK